ncbi:MAG: rubrerythrin [Desulfobacteraceae bacterium]|nr:MAG: rubrerythrin [Desulfobacteraceae bacterium]
MRFGSFEELVNFAIEKEKEAAAFYEEVAGREIFSGSKKMLSDFAKEERKHQKMLEDVLSDKGKLSNYKLEWVPDMKRSNYLVEMKYQQGMHYRDILAIAMKREEKALEFYNDAARENKNEDHVRIFRILAQEEARHKLGLEKLYDDYMAKQGD